MCDQKSLQIYLHYSPLITLLPYYRKGKILMLPLSCSGFASDFYKSDFVSLSHAL